MAEALCGPSNALQTFQKHTSADRTLQQDRSFANKRNEQGFRTANPINHAVDSEFHAFQAPQLPTAPLQRAQLPLAHVIRYKTPPLQVQPEWASDFQNLSLNNFSVPASSIAHRQDQIQHALGGWSAEFTAQRNSLQKQPARVPQPMLNQWQPMHQGLGSYMEDTMYDGSTQLVLPHQINHGQQQFDDAAFAQAFDEAKAEIEQNLDVKGVPGIVQPEQFNMSFACTDPGDVMGEYDFDAAQFNLAAETTKPEIGIDQHIPEHFINRELPNFDTNQPRIGADTIPAKVESKETNPQIEAEELSRTAGHLLDTLKNETSTKFQQSSFLALMRQLRDKEIKVEGDKMVPVTQNSTGTLHPGGRYYPYDAFPTAPIDMTLDMGKN